MTLAQLTDLAKTYHMGTDVTVEALRGVNLTIEEGDYLAIMGPSGSGKSTLLNLMGCLDRPTRGRYILGGEDVSGLSDAALSEVRGRRIGFVFQSFNLIPQLTALDNIEVPLFYQGMHRHERRRRSAELADRVGLGTRARHRPTELSGGEQQRIAIACSPTNPPATSIPRPARKSWTCSANWPTAAGPSSSSRTTCRSASGHTASSAWPTEGWSTGRRDGAEKCKPGPSRCCHSEVRV